MSSKDAGQRRKALIHVQLFQRDGRWQADASAELERVESLATTGVEGVIEDTSANFVSVSREIQAGRNLPCHES
jgi:hypothetical protein